MLRRLSPEQIILLIGGIHGDGYAVKRRILREATVKAARTTLEHRPTPHVRQVLCDILGERRARSAVPALITCLSDPSSGVRGAAADALAKIGNPLAGEALLQRFKGLETSMGVRRMLAVTLGAVGYYPTIPSLIEALEEPDTGIRGSAAWSLGVLRAREAIGTLQRVLEEETGWYAVTRITEALQQLQGRSPRGINHVDSFICMSVTVGDLTETYSYNADGI